MSSSSAMSTAVSACARVVSISETGLSPGVEEIPDRGNVPPPRGLPSAYAGLPVVLS